MAKGTKRWKKGRGKLGILEPLMGKWRAETDSPVGRISCTRSFEPFLRSSYVLLTAIWEIGKGTYEEHAILGSSSEGVSFWSFTSDGKRSTGVLADATDVHPEAIAFEAQMPAGIARMIYWPDDSDGFHWAVEAKNKKGWKRFTEHHYRRA